MSVREVCGGSGRDARAEPVTEPRRNPAEALVGMAVYNGWAKVERLHWHRVAGSAVPADAWRAWKHG